jgi:hypothetical protein
MLFIYKIAIGSFQRITGNVRFSDTFKRVTAPSCEHTIRKVSIHDKYKGYVLTGMHDIKIKSSLNWFDPNMSRGAEPKE